MGGHAQPALLRQLGYVDNGNTTTEWVIFHELVLCLPRVQTFCAFCALCALCAFCADADMQLHGRLWLPCIQGTIWGGRTSVPFEVCRAKCGANSACLAFSSTKSSSPPTCMTCTAASVTKYVANGQYNSYAKAPPAALSGRGPSAAACPAGAAAVAQEACEASNEAWRAATAPGTPARAMRVGTWTHVPRGCSTSRGDRTAHYNTNATAPSTGGANYLPLCGVDPNHRQARDDPCDAPAVGVCKRGAKMQTQKELMQGLFFLFSWLICTHTPWGVRSDEPTTST